MPDDPDYSMVMPFVVTTDNGGPYEPTAFVAGVYFGEASVLLPLLKFGALYRRYVPTPLAGQLDLLCMADGLHIRTREEGEWTYVEIQRGPFDDEVDPDA